MAEILVCTDLPYGDHPRLRLDAFIPRTDCGPRLVVCLHDGWWHRGARTDLHPACFALATSGIPAVSLDFRRLQDVPDADGRELIGDVVAGVRRALEELLVQDCEVAATALFGCGSGGVLALLAGRQLYRDKRVALHSTITCGGLYDFSDLGTYPPDVRTHAKAFVGEHAKELVPLKLDPYSFPPTLILHGAEDRVVPPRAAGDLHAHLDQDANGGRRETIAGGAHELLADPRGEAGGRALAAIRDWMSAPREEQTTDGPTIRVGEPAFLAAERTGLDPEAASPDPS